MRPFDESPQLKNIPSNGSLHSNEADKVLSGRQNTISKKSDKNV